MKEKLTQCLNCQQELLKEENFCPNCGQKNHATQLTIGVLIGNLFNAIFNWDSRLWITLKAAFLRIGQLVQEFNQGKRKKYVPPVQFYLFCSVLYFLFLGFDAKKNETKADELIKQTIETKDTIHVSLGFKVIKLGKSEILAFSKFSTQQIDSLLNQKELEANFYNRFMLKQSVKILVEGISGFQQQINSLASAGMFFLMPILAWLLYLFFARQYPYYIEHLVFSVYLHSIAFLILTLKVVFNLFGFIGWVDIIALLGVIGYTFVAIKQFYNLDWPATIVYYILLMLFYGIILLLFIFITVIIGLILS